jgi:hypothetical protein
MSKPTQRPSDLVQAAEAVENEVRRLEELSLAARRIKLNTDKSIVRAARELQQTMEQQERLAEQLRAFGAVLQGMQVRQQAALEPLNHRGVEIEERMKRLYEHMQRFGAIGVKASEVAKLLQELPGAAPVAAVLIEVDERLMALVNESKELAETTSAEDFTEITREADALRQRLHAMRGRLAELIGAQSVGTN